MADHLFQSLFQIMNHRMKKLNDSVEIDKENLS